MAAFCKHRQGIKYICRYELVIKEHHDATGLTIQNATTALGDRSAEHGDGGGLVHGKKTFQNSGLATQPGLN